MQWSVLFTACWMGLLLLLCHPAGAVTRPEIPAIHTRHATKARHVQNPTFSESVSFEELRARPQSPVDLVEYQVRSAKSKAMVAAIAGSHICCRESHSSRTHTTVHAMSEHRGFHGTVCPLHFDGKFWHRRVSYAESL